MEKIEKILKNPELLTSNDLNNLEEKVKKYPYVQTYRLLYLRALQMIDPQAFEKELPRNSYYFNQPEYIAPYFEGVEKPTVNPKITHTLSTEAAPTPEIEKTETSISEEAPQIPTPKEASEPKTPTATNPSLSVDEQSLIDNLRKLGLEHLIPDNLKNIPTTEESEFAQIKEEKNIAPNEETSRIEEKIEVEIPESSDDIFEVVPDDLEPKSQSEEEPREHSQTNQEAGVPISDEESQEETTEMEQALMEEATEAQAKDTFVTPIITEQITPLNPIEQEPESLAKKVLQNPIEETPSTTEENILTDKITEVESESAIPEEPTISVLHSSKKTFTDWLGMYNRQAQSSKPSSSSGQEDTIDAFIAKKPKIKVDKQDNSPLVDINSIVEDDQQISHLMTETLAKLYVEQRKYNKAIEAYEILILKNPEKSSIFADQIQKLKNLK